MDALIKLEGVERHFKDFALGPLSLTLEAGLFTGLVGPNGAGKTTLIRLLLGLDIPNVGSISLFGLDCRKDEVAIKRQIGFVLAENRLWESLSPRELGKVLARFYPDWDMPRYLKLLERLELPAKKAAAKLSTGQRTRLNVACALAHHARLLILDEPTAGLDPLVRHEVIGLLTEYLDQEGASVLFSSHITSDLDRSADRLLFLLGGQLAFDGDLDRYVESHARVRLAPGRLSAAERSTLLGLRETASVVEGISRDPEYWRRQSDVVVERAELEEIIIGAAQEARR